MDELSKLTRLLRERVKDTYSAVDLDVNEHNPSKEQELLNGIIKGTYSTDEEAARGIYNANAADQRFRMLKSRLRHRLLNLLYFVDYKGSTTKVSSHYEQESANYIYKAKILLREGLDDLAEKMVNKGIAISKETEITEVTLEGLNLLRRLQSFHCRPADFNRTLKELRQYRSLYKIEQEAMDEYFMHRMLVNKSVNSRKKSLSDATQAVGRLEKLWHETKSFNIFEKYYILKVICHESTGDYVKIFGLTEETEKLVAAGKINPIRFDNRYNIFMKTYALLRTKQFKKGLAFAASSLTYFERSSPNWFAHMENYFMLAVRVRDYDLASDIIDEVFGNPNLDKLLPKPMQRWKLLRAYTYHIHPGKYLNDIINFDQFYVSLNILNQDKRGFNVALMVLEFLHHLSRNEKDKLLDKVERFQKYIYRHLNSSIAHRDKLFFKLLLIMIDCSFEAEAAKKKGQKLYEKLVTLDEPGNAYADLEIIPYEDLWQHVINVAKMELENSY